VSDPGWHESRGLRAVDDCPFCRRIAAGEVDRDGGAVVAFADAFPVSEGHMLVAPRRHVRDLFALEPPEWEAVWSLVRVLQYDSAVRAETDGWNIGANVGEAAGQTLDHAHVHLIPRRRGDVEDPRGGVRWVLPGRADYWSDR
jgi:diadenosine tetraphosphate (Ap4A) HIT family hydrolase